MIMFGCWIKQFIGVKNILLTIVDRSRPISLVLKKN